MVDKKLLAAYLAYLRAKRDKGKLTPKEKWFLKKIGE